MTADFLKQVRPLSELELTIASQLGSGSGIHQVLHFQMDIFCFSAIIQMAHLAES